MEQSISNTVERLKGEIVFLEKIQEILREIHRQQVRAYCCSLDYLPHTGGLCPLHPDAPRISVTEALALIEAEIRAFEVQVMDLERD